VQAISTDISSVLRAGSPFSITTRWLNSGLAPVYERWNIQYILQEASTGTVRWSGPSSFGFRFFQPSASATAHTDAFTLPGGLPAGSYRLLVRITDPSNFREPFFLANTGRNADGSYVLASGLEVQGTGASSALVVNAGADIVLPSSVSSVALSGQASGGSISSVTWTRISGPAGTTIATPGSLSTQVSGLVAGVYVFRLTVSETGGQQAFDDLVVIVYNPSSAGRTAMEDQWDGMTLPAEGKPRVYPVPVQRGTPLVVEADPGLTYGIELVSMYGKMVERRTARGTVRLETTNLPAGSYLVRLRFGNQLVTRKIMILQ
jgi:hypothetical protein